jgi:monovalent cation:H+ antiporter-2, CPA2 family
VLLMAVIGPLAARYVEPLVKPLLRPAPVAAKA